MLKPSRRAIDAQSERTSCEAQRRDSHPPEAFTPNVILPPGRGQDPRRSDLAQDRPFEHGHTSTNSASARPIRGGVPIGIRSDPRAPRPTPRLRPGPTDGDFVEFESATPSAAPWPRRHGPERTRHRSRSKAGVENPIDPPSSSTASDGTLGSPGHEPRAPGRPSAGLCIRVEGTDQADCFEQGVIRPMPLMPPMSQTIVYATRISSHHTCRSERQTPLRKGGPIGS